METLKLALTKAQSSKLKKKFKLTNSIQDKLDFWQKELNRNYLFWHKYALEEILDFKIIPNNEHETLQLNEWLFDHGSLLYQDSKAKIYRPYEKMISLFEEKTEKASNLNNLIAHEIDTIKVMFDEKSRVVNFNGPSSQFFKVGYEDYYLQDKEPNLSKHVYETDNLLSLMYGYNLAKFRKHLEELQSSKKEKKALKKEIKLNLTQQLLILEHFGVLKNMGTVDSRKAVFLSAFFGLNSQYVRQHLVELTTTKNPNSKSEKIKFKKELEDILQMFTDLGIKKIAEIVKADIKNISL